MRLLNHRLYFHDIISLSHKYSGIDYLRITYLGITYSQPNKCHYLSIYTISSEGII